MCRTSKHTAVAAVVVYHVHKARRGRVHTNVGSGRGAAKRELLIEARQRSVGVRCEQTNRVSGEPHAGRTNSPRKQQHVGSGDQPESVEDSRYLRCEQRLVRGSKHAAVEVADRTGGDLDDPFGSDGWVVHVPTANVVRISVKLVFRYPVNGGWGSHSHRQCLVFTATNDEPGERGKAARVGEQERTRGSDLAGLHELLAGNRGSLGKGLERKAASSWAPGRRKLCSLRSRRERKWGGRMDPLGIEGSHRCTDEGYNQSLLSLMEPATRMCLHTWRMLFGSAVRPLGASRAWVMAGVAPLRRWSGHREVLGGIPGPCENGCEPSSGSGMSMSAVSTGAWEQKYKRNEANGNGSVSIAHGSARGDAAPTKGS